MSFNRRTGRQSELLYNEELRKVFESIRRMLVDRDVEGNPPEGNMYRELWLDKNKNDMFSYDNENEEWDLLFNDRFRMTGEILSETPPSYPVEGQLWLNQSMLWVYTPRGWTPIKAFDPDSGDIYFANFEDFLLLSPLRKEGNTVVNNGSTEETSQFLTPSLKIGRFFLEHTMKTDYDPVSQVALQYEKKKVEEYRPSWVHVNPGRLTSIKKRLIKVHKNLSSIDVLTHNTEFYGFTKFSPYADLLLPMDDNDEGNYYVQPEGIMLNVKALHKYDYILAITYEFSWSKMTGRMAHSSSEDDLPRYHIGHVKDKINVFIDGYDLEDTFYDHDPSSESLSIEGPMYDTTQLSVWNTLKNEYGAVKRVNQHGEGIIRMRKRFKSPLFFLNGEALYPATDGLTIDENGTVTIPNAIRGMSYSIVETETDEKEYVYKSGLISDVDSNGDSCIKLSDLMDLADEDEGIILFIDGVLVKKEDIQRDYSENTITANGILPGQAYIILRDKEHNLLKEDVLNQAVVTGKVDESLVYVNGQLISNETSIISFESEDQIVEKAYGEIKLFIDPSVESQATYGELRMWDGYAEEWVLCDQDTIDIVNLICFSYSNGTGSVLIHLDLEDDDVVDCYTYNMAQTIENPLRIHSFEWTKNEGKDIPILDRYVPGTNSLQIYFNGIRQLGSKDHEDFPGIKEWENGDGFTIPTEYDGRITYVIESPEEGRSKSCLREVLTREDVLSTPNVYRTTVPLYPGVVNVYVNGMRQSKESFAILDNYTIMFKDKETKIIGHETNYPIELKKHYKNDDKVVELTRERSDIILIEVRDHYTWTEKTFTLYEQDEGELSLPDNNIPTSILEAEDEVLIYINGLFTGFRNEIEYIKNKGKGAISLIDHSYTGLINHDPIYAYLEQSPTKKAEWEKREGKERKQEIKNTYLLEWR